MRFDDALTSSGTKKVNDKANELKEKGNEAFQNGDIPGAIQFYMQALQNNPTHDGAWNNMGLAYRKMDDLAAALKCFNKAVEINPMNESALKNKKRCKEEMERSGEVQAPKLPSEDLKALKTQKTEADEASPSSQETKTSGEEELNSERSPFGIGSNTGVRAEEAVSQPTESFEIPEKEKEEDADADADDAEEQTPPPPPKAEGTVDVDSLPEARVIEIEDGEELVTDEFTGRKEYERGREEVRVREEGDDEYVVEERLGPLGLRPTRVVRTSREKEYADEYMKRRKVRDAVRHSEKRDEISPGRGHGEREGGGTSQRGERLCSYCRNSITSENRSIRCSDCGGFFCATCEQDFRGAREKGEVPLCAKCFLNFVKDRELERLRRERRQRLDMQERDPRFKDRKKEDGRWEHRLGRDEEKKERKRSWLSKSIKDRRDDEEEEKAEGREEPGGRQRGAKEISGGPGAGGDGDGEGYEGRGKGEERGSGGTLTDGGGDGDEDRRVKGESPGSEDIKDTFLGIVGTGRSEGVKESMEASNELIDHIQTFLKGEDKEDIGKKVRTSGDEDMFTSLASKFEAGEISLEEYERLIEESLDEG